MHLFHNNLSKQKMRYWVVSMFLKAFVRQGNVCRVTTYEISGPNIVGYRRGFG